VPTAASKSDGPKNFGVPEKKSSPFIRKKTIFFSGTPNFFDPSYFEAALASIKHALLPIRPKNRLKMYARILSNNPLIYWFLIKGMIEEHLENTEKVRQNTERRCREEHAAIRHQSEEHAGQLAQLTAELERSQRKEMDLKKQIGDLKNISDRGMYIVLILVVEFSASSHC
jgi:hypothetical protein